MAVENWLDGMLQTRERSELGGFDRGEIADRDQVRIFIDVYSVCRNSTRSRIARLYCGILHLKTSHMCCGPEYAELLVEAARPWARGSDGKVPGRLKSSDEYLRFHYNLDASIQPFLSESGGKLRKVQSRRHRKPPTKFWVHSGGARACLEGPAWRARR